MKRFAIFVLLAFLVCLPNASPATDVGGIINTDTTWDLAGSPYNITSKIQIAEGVTLAIEPGVVVNGESGSIDFEVWGHISAIGTDTSNILWNDVGRVDFKSHSSRVPSVNIKYAQIVPNVDNSGSNLFKG